MSATSPVRGDVPETMQAAVLVAPKTALRLEEVRTPVPSRGEALVSVRACGVCHTDLHVMKDEVAFPTPAVLGHEIVGDVVALGEGVDPDSGIAPGVPVVGAFIMPCGTCSHCANGRDDLCSKFFAMNRLRGQLYDGQSRLYRQDGTELAMYSMGGLAEYAVVPVTALTPLPEELAVPEAAIIGCAVLTAYGAVRRAADLRVGETVAVVAMGGIGSNIVQIAKAFGARTVIAVDVSDDKLAVASTLGATHTVNARSTDPVAEVMKATDGRGVDVAFEAFGSAMTFRQAAEMLADGGRMVPVGIAPGTTTADVQITRLVRRSQRIIGSYGARVRTDLPEVVKLVSDGLLRPTDTVTRKFSLAESDLAYSLLDAGEISGRAIIEMKLEGQA